MFTIEQWRRDDKYVVRFLMNGEPIGTMKLKRKATDEELKELLDIFAEKVVEEMDNAILYGETGRKTGGKHA